jgi:hypothetical protein
VARTEEQRREQEKWRCEQRRQRLASWGGSWLVEELPISLSSISICTRV